MRKNTIEVLKQLQAPFAQSGFEYIVDAVEIINQDRSKYRKNLSRLYYAVGECKGISETNVERGIRTTKESIFSKANEDLLIEIFGNKDSMKNGDFLYALSYEVED